MREYTVVRSKLKDIIRQENIKRLQAKQEVLSIRDVAAACDLAPSIISGLTSNRSGRIDFKTINKICAYFGITPGDLLEFTPDNESEDTSEK